MISYLHTNIKIMQEVIQHALFLQLDITLLLKVIKVTTRGQNPCFHKTILSIIRNKILFS